MPYCRDRNQLMKGIIFSLDANLAMKGIVLLLICLAVLSAGCVQKESGNGKAGSTSPLSAEITSLKFGEIFTGDQEVRFDSDVTGGKAPYTYKWTSNIDGVMSTGRSFSKSASEMGKGEHSIILKVTDDAGNSTEASVTIYVFDKS